MSTAQTNRSAFPARGPPCLQNTEIRRAPEECKRELTTPAIGNLRDCGESHLRPVDMWRRARDPDHPNTACRAGLRGAEATTGDVRTASRVNTERGTARTTGTLRTDAPVNVTALPKPGGGIRHLCPRQGYERISTLRRGGRATP